MVLWFVGLAPVIVWFVFRDPAMDHRVVALGAVVPLVDLIWHPLAPLHSLVVSAALLGVVMVATRGRRRLRRRLLALPIGTFLHLLLDGAWTEPVTFWWPLLGSDLPDAPIGPLARPGALLAVMEVAGVAAMVWFVGRFRLVDRDRRRTFVRTGRLDRDLAGPPPIR